jgi:hypothetical protein
MMKKYLLLWIILTAILLGASPGEFLFQTNQQRIASYLERNPSSLEWALAPVRTHMNAYYSGDLQALRCAWRKNGVVETQRFSLPNKDGLTESQNLRVGIETWTQALDSQIQKLGLAKWQKMQRQPDHELHLTVLNISDMGALILVEDPMQYSMGTQSHSAMIFKVVYNSMAPISSPLSPEAMITQMNLDMGGC